MRGPGDRAQRLRRDQTDAESKLWSRLRGRQLSMAKFRCQHVIGKYIADFYCPERKLVVEIDGGQHAEQAEADQRRTKFLLQRGYRVLRFWDNDVLVNTDAVMERIAEALSDPHPPTLSLARRGWNNRQLRLRRNRKGLRESDSAVE